jgi:SWI/SNF-related matrix-associated actin-dependent regulator of chromatin subfamily A member 5
VLGKWIKEMAEWIPSVRVFSFYGSNQEREVMKERLRDHSYDVIITTFETVMKEKHELSKYYFEYLILDEAQRIKNDESVLS